MRRFPILEEIRERILREQNVVLDAQEQPDIQDEEEPTRSASLLEALDLKLVTSRVPLVEKLHEPVSRQWFIDQTFKSHFLSKQRASTPVVTPTPPPPERENKRKRRKRLYKTTHQAFQKDKAINVIFDGSFSVKHHCSSRNIVDGSFAGFMMFRKNPCPLGQKLSGKEYLRLNHGRMGDPLSQRDPAWSSCWS